MDSKLPTKYKKGFLENLLLKIRRLFYKKSMSVSSDKKVDSFNQKSNLKEAKTYFDEMKYQSKKITVKEDIVSIINKKPELIDSLDIMQLYEIRNIYNEIIEKNDRKINRLKKAIN